MDARCGRHEHELHQALQISSLTTPLPMSTLYGLTRMHYSRCCGFMATVNALPTLEHVNAQMSTGTRR
jgi:hypothetical protein